ncbi:MAG: UbiD family decarboxylase [Chloroflexi bacterium]|nr:UbiD family decarboxylase [Chloroflexota bacterium]
MEDLREYIELAKGLGELKVIEGADWDLEIGAIVDWQSEPGTPLLLFDKVKGYKPGFRVMANFGTAPKRLALAMGLPPETERPMDFVKAWRDKLRQGFKPVPPVEVDTGPIRENIYTGDDVDLFMFPTPRWHRRDGGRYIGTGDMVIMRDPDDGWVNMGTYRVQIHDKKTATIYMAEGKHGEIIKKKYWDRGEACPVAVVCGQDPQLWIASYQALPLLVSEYDYAGWLRKKPVEVVKGVFTGLPIPATAEIVIEGELVPPEVETRIEGPFGEWSGYYAGGSEPVPAFRVKAVMHRNDPILWGAPPFRRKPLFEYGGRNIIRAAQLWDNMDSQMPNIKGVWMSEEATGALIIVISVKQSYQGHAKQAGMAVLSDRLSAYSNRFIIVVDDDIDPSNMSDVLWALGTRCDPAEDIDILRNCRSFRLDPRLPPEKRESNDLTTSRALILACKPYRWIKEFPIAVECEPEYMAQIKNKWHDVFG